MKTLATKLQSRKFWVAVVSFVTAIILYVTNDEENASKVGELIMAGASVIGYMIGEGLADSSNTTIVVDEKESPR